MASHMDNKVSYLQAKDQTIIILSRANLRNCRVNLGNEMMEDQNAELLVDDKHIPVYLRIKGGGPEMDLYTIEGNKLICRVPEGSYSFRNLKPDDVMSRTYKFSEIFGPNSTQIEIFNNIVKPKILDFINGKHGTLFTYGTTGSGKTFTIVGTPAEPGIIPRALEYIFRTIPTLSDNPEAMPLPNGEVLFLSEEQMVVEGQKKYEILKRIHNERIMHTKTYRQMQQRLSSQPVAELEDFSNISISIWVSFAEIYNECVYDLLKPLPKNKIRPKLQLGHAAGQVYIKDLSSVCILNGLEAYQIHQYGIQNLNYAATALNAHSSRSHAIFTIKMVQSSKIDGSMRISCLRFCDLAGSERSKKTLNIGDRLKESNNINRSLLALGRCIEGVRNLQQSKDKYLIPFRESKLTLLFQYALLGQENIAMIVNLNPLKSMFEESHHALNFSSITKDIIIEEKPVTQIKRNFDEKEEIERLQNMVTDLYAEIEHMKIEHEKEVLEEKHYVADMYKNYLKELKAKHEEEIKSELKRKTEYLEQKIERLERRVFETEVINISDSSDDSFSRSFLESEIQDLQQRCTILEEHNKELKNANMSVELEKQALIKELEVMKRQTPQGIREKQLTKSIEYDKVIFDMRRQIDDLEKENKIYKSEIKKLIVQNIKLNDQCDDLNILSFGGPSTVTDEENNSAKSGLPRETTN